MCAAASWVNTYHASYRLQGEIHLVVKQGDTRARCRLVRQKVVVRGKADKNGPTEELLDDRKMFRRSGRFREPYRLTVTWFKVLGGVDGDAYCGDFAEVQAGDVQG